MLQDDLAIRVEGAMPGESISIRCAVRDVEGHEWRACGRFSADRDGAVDTGSMPSQGGTYCGVDVGGLFWSMRPSQMREGETRAGYCERALADTALPLMPEFEPLAALECDIVAHSEDGERRTDAKLSRQRVAPGTEVEVVASGNLQGVAFHHDDGARRPGVLVLGGSEGGLLPARAAALAAEGFVTLALGYFDYKERPKAAINLPLEYFRDALRWLRERSTVSAVFGASRGSEAAILTACHFPELVDAVVAWVPSPVANTGFDMAAGDHFANETRAMWSFEGVSIPGVQLPAENPNVRAKQVADMSRFPGYSFAPEFLNAWQEQSPTSEFALPVERLRAPVFLAGGRDDQLWPSAYGAEQIGALLAKNGFEKTVECRVYPNAGHMIGVPNEVRPFSDVVRWVDGYSGVDRGLVHYGGTPEGNASAARRSWQDVVQFLRSTLCEAEVH